MLDAVCWKGTLPRLGIKPEEGMEVIATGSITTYAGSSRYQIVIERMELAGVGALLELLEERRKKLAAEGLFDAERKRPLPFLPEVIGVVTSPTGAVIRDILHRLADRFPRHVLVWPVAVQGEKAAAEVAAAIAGFNALPPGGPVPRPDLLIVARGGGCLEDLWAFNEEIVVRAAAASTIPLISAVGHETDTTLIDFASDRRAPTPTRRRRDGGAGARRPAGRRRSTSASAHGLHDPRAARGDDRARGPGARPARSAAPDRGAPAAARCQRRAAGDRDARAGRAAGHGWSARGSPARRPSSLPRSRHWSPKSRVLEGAMRRYAGDTRQKIDRTADRLEQYAERLKRGSGEVLARYGERVDQLGKLLESYSFHSVLNRGFALVRDQDGQPVLAAAGAHTGDAISIEFADGRVSARVTDGLGDRAASGTGPSAPARGRHGNQGSLL